MTPWLGTRKRRTSGKELQREISFFVVSLNPAVRMFARLAQLVRYHPGFNPLPGRALNFGRPSLVILSVNRDVKPLVLVSLFIEMLGVSV